MAITAKDVQKLREMTGVGMMDCKKALTASEGDFDKAIEWLREKGKAASVKKAGKVAAEGVSYAAVINGVGVVIEVNSQTDFVAKNEIFQTFVRDLATVVATEAPVDVEALKACCRKEGRRTIHCYRTTGDNLYFLDMYFLDMEALDAFLAEVEPLGSYELHVVLREAEDLAE